MSRDQVSPAHMQRWDSIRQLEEQVTKENKNKYNMEDLKKKCVRILRMNYDSNLEPTFRPCFFELYKGELSAEPRDEQRVASGWEWDPYHENEEADPIEWAEDTIYYFFDYLAAQGVDNEDKGVKLPLRRMMSPGSFTGKVLHQYGRNTDGLEDWFAMGGNFVDKQSPQFILELLSDTNGENDTIHRGELLGILRMMEKLHAPVKFANHHITPILVLSFMGPRHARALQAYYDGDELVIHKTDLFDFTKCKNTDALLLFTRFEAGTAVGDTIAEKKRIAE